MKELELLQNAIKAIIQGKSDEIKSLVEYSLKEGVSPVVMINEGMIPGMSVIAEKFKNNEIFVPEVILAAKAMQGGLSILKPLLVGTNHKPLGKVVIGTVKGDQHDIGKNLVGMMLEGAGFEVIDLGTNVASDKFLSKIVEVKPQIVALSALLTTTMPEMSVLTQRLENEGLRKQVKVLIGGAPVSQSYAEKIGADGYASDAGDAVEVAKKLLAL